MIEGTVVVDDLERAAPECSGKLSDHRITGDSKPAPRQPLGTGLGIRQRHQRMQRSPTIVWGKHVEAERAGDMGHDGAAGPN